MENNEVSRIGIEDRKRLVYDFTCRDEREFIGTVSLDIDFFAFLAYNKSY